MTKVTCYKCDTEVDNTQETAVHPLCEDCDTSFMDWFNTELAKLDGV